ncbi:uncharacterized protein LOC120143888 [Hibiscus syriacus]|uniref:uncharacterized protein LOC120143888 n=1 Tax=Hibiscus syriacus TaxID=106335 RepID=UPI00192354F2|nr:uncharacterized protein LOC120143888 [Hibiscus syriacus]
MLGIYAKPNAGFDRFTRCSNFERPNKFIGTFHDKTIGSIWHSTLIYEFIGTLTLGHAYRLITSQGLKVMRAKKIAKTKWESMKKLQHHGQDKLSSRRKSDAETTNQVQEQKQERQSSRKTHVNAAAMRSKSWRPSLQSISEAAS